MFVLRLVMRNAFRHRLRVALTVIGLMVAIAAFGLLRTVVQAWYAGVDATSSTRLITRNAISLVFPMPLTYAARIRQQPGVDTVSWANWFGGVYIEEKNFFAQFAVDGATYFALYPEYRMAGDAYKAFMTDRKGVVVGRKLAGKFGWKLGDDIRLRGTIYPGDWSFTVRAIYQGADVKTDESQFLFHWDYLNESIKRQFPRRANQVGAYVIRLDDPGQAAQVAHSVDALFQNSLAETLTETEKAFQLGFVAMTEVILIAIQVVSFVVILIIMAVMANTIAMTARERTAEYATFKALGFSPGFVARLIVAESLAIVCVGGGLGIAATFPVAQAFAQAVGTLFPVFFVARETVILQVVAALVVGLVAAAWPAWRSCRVSIVDGLRHVA